MSHAPTPETKYSSKRRRTELLSKLYGYLPYIKRKRHNKLLARLTAQIDKVSDYLLALPNLATSVPIDARIPVEIGAANEVCLFVSFASEPFLKSHVIDHICALLAHNIAVVLIINTPHVTGQFSLDPKFAMRLSGCLIRANSGFDFAAWAHAYTLLSIPPRCERLYLINDSIVGPLQQVAYTKMIAGIRSSSADMIGLTENHNPRPHVQSYFIAINRRLLTSSVFDLFMRGVVNMPTKEEVIAQYETQLTRFFRAKGFRCKALFTDFPRHQLLGLENDTIFNWARLIEAGFPFIKASVLDVSSNTPEALRWVPQRYLNPP